MDFAECVFIGTNSQKDGCSIKVMYPKSVYSQLNLPLSRILFPKGRDMKNAFVRFFIGKTSESNIHKIDNVSPLFDAVITCYSEKTRETQQISNNAFSPIACYLYNAQLHLAMLNTSNKTDIIWDKSIESFLTWKSDASKKTCSLRITPHDILSLQFWSTEQLTSFIQSYEQLRHLLLQAKNDKLPIGILPSFSHLYYGCGVVFSINQMQAILGVVSSSFLSFSSMELFLLKILQEENASLVQRLYLLLNSSQLPVSLTPMESLQSSVQQLYFQYSQNNTLSNEPCLSRDIYKRTIKCEWVLQKRIPFDYSTLFTPTQLVHPIPSSFIPAIQLLHTSLFICFDAILSGKRVILLSETFTLEQIQDLLLLIGSLMAEVVPIIFQYLFLTVDLEFLSYLYSQQVSWFLTGTNLPSIINHTKYYDFCMDLDHQKVYTSNSIAKEFHYSNELNWFDQITIQKWLDEYQIEKNEYRLFYKIKSYMHKVGLLLFSKTSREYMMKNDEIAVLKDRIEMLEKSVTFNGLLHQYEKQEVEQGEIFEAINQLAYSSEISTENLEKCFNCIEVATRETVNIYKLIIALSLCDKDISFLFTAVYSSSKTVKMNAIRILERIEKNSTTSFFINDLSPLDQMILKKLKSSAL